MGSTPVGLYSASGVSAILGLNQYKTPVHAWQEIMEKLEPGFNGKMGYKLPVFEESAAIRWGLAFEDAVIRLAEERENSEIIHREKAFDIGFGDFSLTCHIDGQFKKFSDGLAVLHEGKTTNTRAFYQIKDEKKRWGDPGTDECPEEYQIQAAVQRICTGAELVKLSVLVFPNPQQEYEDLGWIVQEDGIIYKETKEFGIDDGVCIDKKEWCDVLNEMGNFHEYHLPTNEPLEKIIIEKIQQFDRDFVQTKIPPTPKNYDDVRRLLTNPIGTVLATESLAEKAREYSEITAQIGDSGPLAKRKDKLKTEILSEVMTTKKDDWADPPNKVIIINPEGGEVLASFSKDKNGKLTFRAEKA